MTAQERMQYVLDMVINVNNPIPYSVCITGDDSFLIHQNNKAYLSVTSVKHIHSHWREHISNVINQIISERIKKALNEI